MSARFITSVVAPTLTALALAVMPAQALAATTASIDSATCTKGGGKVVRQPIGPITQPLYKCQGGKYSGRVVAVYTDTHSHSSSPTGGLLNGH